MATVLITGGSRGIGAATVAAFANAGHRVFFLYEKDHAAAAKVRQETGATAICCDVASQESVQAALSIFKDLDVLVCNAGICHTGLFHQLPEEDFDRLMDVNVKGVYNCIKAATPLFLKNQAGAIITVSSMWGIVGASCEVAYSATKGAVIAMTKALAQELGPSGIRVNCVAPGVILIDMCKDVSPETLEALKEQTPLGRNGTAQDVASTILYLADAPFVTGQVLGVNGGFVV